MKTPIQKKKKKNLISMYFLRKINFYFPSKEKISCFLEKNTSFPDNTRKIMFQCKYRLKIKVIFLGKGNIIFPDNIRNIKIQRNFFGKTNFPKHLENENMFLRAMYYLLSNYNFLLLNQKIIS